MVTLQTLRARRRRQSGFSLIELLIVIAIILIILAIALPQMNKTRMHAQETAAKTQLRTLQQAESQYLSQFGRYAVSLSELGPATGNAVEGPSAAGLIPASLASGVNTGYKFTISATPTGYAISAQPVTYNGTGRVSYYSDASGIIRESWGQDPATAQSAEIK